MPWALIWSPSDHQVVQRPFKAQSPLFPLLICFLPPCIVMGMYVLLNFADNFLAVLTRACCRISAGLLLLFAQDLSACGVVLGGQRLHWVMLQRLYLD